MTYNGIKIDLEGFNFKQDQEEKFKGLIDRVRQALPISNLRFRFVKSGRLIEGMAWCEAAGIPIGAYNRSPSVSLLLESLFKKLNKECRRTLKLSCTGFSQKSFEPSYNNNNYDLAG